MVNYVAYPSSRLVWTYLYGDPGPLMVDHINRLRDDDRIENLRLVTCNENRRYSKMYRTNTSGYKGVTLDKSVNRWKAYIYVNGKRRHLGLFATKDEAAEDYAKAASELHGIYAGAKR